VEERRISQRNSRPKTLTVAPQRFWATFGCLLETSYIISGRRDNQLVSISIGSIRGYFAMDFVTPLLGLLVPHLPALLMKAAEDVVGEGAKKAVYEAVPGGVKAIWAKLRPKVEASAIAKASADQVVAQPEDQDAQVMLKLALKKVLEDLAKTEPALIGELQTLLKAAQVESAASTVVNVNGTDAQAFVNVTAKNVVGKVEGDATFQ
jgi:hypothetical protein